MTNTQRKEIAERLKKLRTDTELTQSDLAKYLEPLYKPLINRAKGAKENKVFSEENGKATISALENNNRVITVDIALAYSEYFKVSVDYILGLSKDWKPENKEIKDVIGLTDRSIDEIKKYVNHDIDDVNLKTLNQFFSEKWLFIIVNLLHDFVIKNEVYRLEINKSNITSPESDAFLKDYYDLSKWKFINKMSEIFNSIYEHIQKDKDTFLPGIFKYCKDPDNFKSLFKKYKDDIFEE